MNTNEATLLDCRGQRCPQPILALSKQARGLAANGGLVEVLADDAAFPLDLKAWCRSAGAELLQLSEDHGVNRGIVRVPSRGAADTRGSGASRVPKAPPPPPPEVKVNELLDCRGARCPEPILKLSRLARTASPGTTIEVVADDDAFPLDLESWCRSSGVVVESLETVGMEHRARVKVPETKTPAKRAPSKASATALVPASSSLVPVEEPSSSFAFTADLRRIDSAGWKPLLDAAASGLSAGQAMRVFVPDAASVGAITGWSVETGHSITRLETFKEPYVDISIAEGAQMSQSDETALVKASAAADCTLLVLHNDHEALLASLLVAVGAASQGRDVVVFFTFWGLNLLRGDTPNPDAPVEKVSWMQAMMKKMMPAGPKRQSLGQMNFGGMGKMMLGKIMDDNNIMSLPDLMATAESQGVRFIACTMSMDVMGIRKRDLAPRSNLEFGGVAAFVDAAYGSGMSLVF